MSVDEAKKKLGGLSKHEMKKARTYEKGNKDRKTLVEWLDGEIED